MFSICSQVTMGRYSNPGLLQCASWPIYWRTRSARAASKVSFHYHVILATMILQNRDVASLITRSAPTFFWLLLLLSFGLCSGRVVKNGEGLGVFITWTTSGGAHSWFGRSKISSPFIWLALSTSLHSASV